MLDSNQVRAAFPHLARLRVSEYGRRWTILDGAGKKRPPSSMTRASRKGHGRRPGVGGESDRGEMGAGPISWRCRLIPSILSGSTTRGAQPRGAEASPWSAATRSVVAEDEFPSVVQSWLSWQRQGVELIHVPIAHESEGGRRCCVRQ